MPTTPASPVPTDILEIGERVDELLKARYDDITRFLGAQFDAG